MNILIFSWRGPKHPHAGGAEIVTHEYAKAWVSSGHSVTLFTSSFNGAKEKEVIDGVNIIRQGSQILSVQIKGFLWYLFSKSEGFDLVIDQFHGIPFFTPIYVRAKKLAFIHEVTKEIWRLNHLKKPFNIIFAFLGELFEEWIFRLFYRNVSFMTVSQSTREDLIKWGIKGSKITVIPNGLNLPKLKISTKKEKQITVAYLGSLSRDKGIEDAIRVFGRVAFKKPDWQFWVIGKGEESYLKILKKIAADLNVLSKINFFGFVNEDMKYKLIAKAHFLVNPSVREGWGLVVIEAAAVGTPTIAFDVAGLRDSILDKKTGIICKEKSVDEMSYELIEILENQKMYQKMSKRAQEWSKEFEWSKSTAQSLRLIKNV